MWKVLSFQTRDKLELYLRTQQTVDPAAAANPVAQAKVVAVLSDSANGGFTLVIAP